MLLFRINSIYFNRNPTKIMQTDNFNLEQQRLQN